ncbi:hypothetical protein F2Q68_00037534 [Brassica cretica]|uniref:Uncharacterized protein n=1 Tax=Brassica cretica TaxID=69181 RepID=A0A8S9H709_BRACR|nr:hypothetical protein F2Q68_00037534 [Brassica cretica]
MTFLHREGFSRTLYQWNIKSETSKLEAQKIFSVKVRNILEFIKNIQSIRTGAGKYSGLIAGQNFTGRIEIAQMNREARGVSMHESRTWCQVSSNLSVNRSTTCRRA